jgi:hypothetical protein
VFISVNKLFISSCSVMPLAGLVGLGLVVIGYKSRACAPFD